MRVPASLTPGKREFPSDFVHSQLKHRSCGDILAYG
jgi:hypothetical protein